MICSSCKGARHGECLNSGKDTNTWCDCQHKVPGAQDVVVDWTKGPDGITRKVGVNGFVQLYGEDVPTDLAGLSTGDLPTRQ